MRKYEIVDGRVKALRDFSDVKKGEVGGYVKGEHNLSHEGDCWVYEGAKVSEYADVYGDAKVYGYAKVSGDIVVSGYVVVSRNEQINRKTST